MLKGENGLEIKNWNKENVIKAAQYFIKINQGNNIYEKKINHPVLNIINNYASDENKNSIQNDNHTNNFNQNNNIRFNDEKFVKSKISEKKGFII